MCHPLKLMCVQTYDAPVITYSHFLPRLECLPSITSKFMKASLPLVIGCPELDIQIRKVKSVIHVFGHTHLNVDKTVDGVRYVQNAFGAQKRNYWLHAIMTLAQGTHRSAVDSICSNCQRLSSASTRYLGLRAERNALPVVQKCIYLICYSTGGVC